MLKITDLKTEHSTSPLGVEVLPVFSWNVQTDTRGWFQEAYQILVSDSRQALEAGAQILWNSGRVSSGEMTSIPYDGKALKSGRTYYWKVRVWGKGEETPCAYSAVHFWTTGLLSPSDWKAKWIGEENDLEGHIFRKTFEAKKPLKSATAYVSGLGHFELYVNGKRAGDAVLEPGWTNYNKSCFYCVYDVTGALQGGKNALGVFLGDGMFNLPTTGRYVYFERSYGKMKLLLQLHLEYADGTSEYITTDESWSMAQSPLTFSQMYGGEDFDARLEPDGWMLPDFVQDERWKPVLMVEAPKGRLTAQKNPPVKVMERLLPVSVVQTGDGVYLYDFGQNFSGWAKIRLSAKNAAGQAVDMVPGEVLARDMKPDQRVTGRGYRWRYILNDKAEQVWHPRFTYTGFRYVQVTGAVPRELAGANETRPVVEALEGEYLYCDVETAGEFSCSNTLFNQIHTIILNAMKSNMKSVLTDCPHRERLGWLEQTHLIGPALLYNFDLQTLYAKIQQDMLEAQYENGHIPDIAPEYILFGYHAGFRDSPEWGCASVINPWWLYKKYGDASVLRRYYPMMKAYLDYLTSKTHHAILHHGLGDWLDIGPNTPHSQNTPVPVIATSVYYQSLQILCRAAELLDKAEDVKKYSALAAEVKREFNLQFFDDQTFRYATGSQAAQAMALVVGLAQEEYLPQILDYLVRDIEKRGYATTAGDIGHPYVLAALTRFGRSDVINAMFNDTEKPGYGYQVRCGATTLAEEWDGPNPEHPHASQNHFMLGSGEEWFYAGLAGIGGVRTQSSAAVIELSPYFAKGVDWVRAWHRHPYGRVVSEWQRNPDGIQLTVEIPPNTAGILRVRGGANDFEKIFGVEKVLLSPEETEIHFVSGRYVFDLQKEAAHDFEQQ